MSKHKNQNFAIRRLNIQAQCY